jgi:AraC-like DNA-binding protein
LPGAALLAGATYLAGIMEFTIHEAPALLADSVKAIWCARGTRQEFDAPEPIVPDGCVEIVFNLGDRFVDAETGELQPRDLLAGQMTRPVTALPTGTVDLIGVRFRTGRAGTALRIPMWELQDRLIAASQVLPNLERLTDDLRNIAAAGRIDHLAAALAPRLAAADADSVSAVDHALAIITAARGNVAIERVARRVGITRRHLERQFRGYVGLGAKHVARIARIHSALELLQHQPAMSGVEIAGACGYSDQAHLIRECRALAGATPSRLESAEPSLSGLMRTPGGPPTFANATVGRH